MPVVPIRIFVGFARDTRVPNVDVVLASGEISTGRNTQCDVEAAGSVATERLVPSGRVVKAGRVVKERGSTCGSVVATGHLNIWIASHCRRSNGGVVAARCAEEGSIIASGGIIVAIAVLERRLPDRRIVEASGVHFQRTGTDSRVSNAPSARFKSALMSRVWKKSCQLVKQKL